MIHSTLKNTKIVLASESPRRKILLEMLGLKPLVIPAKIAEPITDDKPYRQAMMHARNKADAIAKHMEPDAFIIAADTIVVLDGQILGKPSTADDARDYLRLLSGKSHNVYTGICLMHKGRKSWDYERSKVEFCELSDAEIEDYLKTGEPFDKAGAYGIQGFGAQFIRKINGCYFNVMGFPINLFYRMIREIESFV